MKISNEIKKALPCVWKDYMGREYYPCRKIVFCLDHKDEECYYLDDADAMHRNLIYKGYVLLPDARPEIQEYNIVLRYARATYNRWRID